MNLIYPITVRRTASRKWDLIITLAFLLSLLFALPAATANAQSDEPNDSPPTPQEENWASLDSLNNHLYLPYINSAATDNVPADVLEQVAADELGALATNVARCNERSNWLTGQRVWSGFYWNTVISGCPNIYVNPSVSGYVQVAYYSNSRRQWVWKPYQWVSGRTWTEVGNNFSAGTNWYVRFYNTSSMSWLQLKTTSGRLITSNPPQPQPGNSNDLLTHSQAVSVLSSGGITQITSTDSCTDKNIRTCTSLDGVRRGSLQGLIDFKAECDAAMGGDCWIYVTGGTEIGHSGCYNVGDASCNDTTLKNHRNGYKIDIRWSFGNGHNDAGRYIRANFPQVSSWVSNGVTYTKYEDSSTGRTYLFEDYSGTSRPGNTHWDICFGC